MLHVALLVLAASLRLGDSDLLHYRLPDAAASAFTLELGQGDYLRTTDAGSNIYFMLDPGYQVMVLGERLNLSAGADVGVSGEPLHVYPSRSRARVDRRTYYEVNPGMSAALDWYPLHFPLGLGADFHVRSHFYWSHSVPKPDENNTPECDRSDLDGSGHLAIGLSLGRFRDAQPVIQALRIYELIEQPGEQPREPDKDDVEALAQLIARRPVIGLRFHQPAKDWFQELEGLLHTRGLIAGRLPARTWFLIREVLEDAPALARPVGARFSIRPGEYVGWSSQTADTTQPVTESHRHPSLTMRLESGYPLSRRWQFGENADWQIAWDSAGATHRLNAAVSLDYHVFDRFLVAFSYAGSYANRATHYIGDTSGEEVRWREWNHGPEITATYFREDALTLSGSVGLLQSGWNQTFTAGPFVSQLSATWGLSLSYRLPKSL